jgi:hypothetical protein
VTTETLTHRADKREPASLRAAINAKCRDCCYDPLAGGKWREQISRCPCTDCPLWPVRPAPESGHFAHPARDRREVPPKSLAEPGKPGETAGFPTERPDPHHVGLSAPADGPCSRSERA